MTKNDRLKKAREDLGLTQQDLADLLGVSQSYINGLEKDKGFSNKKAKQLAGLLKVDSNWLLKGDNADSIDSEKRDFPKLSKSGVPYYDVDFIGGFDILINDQSINPLYYIDFSPYNDADCWLNVTGKSMGPLIAHGDIVALKEVYGWKEFLLEGEIYAIVTKNGFRTIKIIGPGPDSDHYMLQPYNKEYKPQPIPKNIITRIFRVKGALKKFF